MQIFQRTREAGQRPAVAASASGLPPSGDEVRREYRALGRALCPPEISAPAIAVCGWTAEDGASEVAAGLARALAHDGVAVTLADWTPDGSHRTGLPEAGLDDGAAGTPPGRSARAPRIRVIAPAAGPEPDAEQAQLLRVIADVKRTGGCILLDLPPLRDAAGLGDLGPALDGTLLVVRRDATRRDDARRAAGLLRGLSAPFLGVVLVQDADRWWGPIWPRLAKGPRR